jgi:hypothetical protein
MAMAVVVIIDGIIIIDLVVFCDFYYGLILFYQQLFEFLVLLNKLKD